MSVVQFDMDGVLANFGAGYDEECVHLGVPAPGPEAPWDAKWDKTVWKAIKQSPSFWFGLSPLVSMHAFARINRLETVYFVTARPGFRTKWQSERWLASVGIYNPTVIVTPRKGEFARAAGVTHAIDDKAGNAVYTAYESPETKSFLLDAPYNQFDHTVLGTKVIRIAAVEEFLDAIEVC